MEIPEKPAGSFTNTRATFLLPFLLYTIYSFIYLLTDSVLLEKGGALHPGDFNPLNVYAITLTVTAVGYALFAIFDKLNLSKLTRKLFTMAFAVIFLVGSFGVVIGNSRVGYHIFSMLAALGLGYTGGVTHYYISMILKNSNHIGRIVGTALSVALAVQYCVENFLETNTAILIALGFGFLLFSFFVIQPPHEWAFEQSLQPDDGKSPSRVRVMTVLVVLCAVMTVLLALPETVIRQYSAVDALSVFRYSGFPRLIFAASALIAGIFADMRRPFWFRAVTCCTALLCVLIPFLVVDSKQSSQWLASAITYAYAGFYCAFVTTMFLKAAPRTKYPRFWACMSRIIRCVVTAIMIPVTTAVFNLIEDSANNQLYMVAINLVLATACVLIMSLLGRTIRAADRENAEKTLEAARSDSSLKDFSLRHGLTPRETEVLEKVLKSEKSIRELAAEMYLSERVAQRYLTSIYEKTGTKSRIGLFIAFYGSNANA